jgi:Domain of unknown function (DU1801)
MHVSLSRHQVEKGFIDMRLDWNGFSEALPRDEKLIFKHLRDFVLATEPRLIESKSYGVPYYSRNKRICFIWPVSAPDAPKAKNQKDDGTLVSLGFCYGNLLSNVQGLLLAEGRKQVYIIRLRSLKQFMSMENQVAEIINEAVLLDELSTKKNKTS